jgi:hypothetical protein
MRRCPMLGCVLERRGGRRGNDRGVGLRRCGWILVFVVMEEVQGGYGYGIVWGSIEICENVEITL